LNQFLFFNFHSRLIDVLIDSINKGDTTTMGKWAMRALVPIVGSNEQQLEHIITHNLFGKVNKYLLYKN
jgi:hypothetical protein